ncbi:MAG: diacylglycerol kinase family lipid kinase [Caldilineaceae bacterium]|nr:diacylglycerol kinase family lipid kinase [Caldilineaceae bacterium]
MRTRRASLIHNPNAGMTESRDNIDQFLKFWRSRGWDITPAPTRHAGHATELAREAAERGDRLLFAAGGDGTLNEVANGLAKSETILAPLPFGTANVLAKEIGIPMPNLLDGAWLLKVSRLLADGRVHSMDLGLCNDERYWLLWASAGMDAFLIEQSEPRPRWIKRLGMAGYAAQISLSLPRASSMRARIQVDDEYMEGEYLVVNISNSRRYAGGALELNPFGVLDDGQFEVYAFEGGNLVDVVEQTIKVSMKNHYSDARVQVVTGRSVRIETENPVPFHLDAEPGGHTPLTCTLAPGALRILAPADAPAKLFKQPGQALNEEPA